MKPNLRVLAEGTAEYPFLLPREFRDWVRKNKPREQAPKLMTASDAVGKFVTDGDYLVYECEYLHSGPAALVREVIRQRRKDLWIRGKFTYVDVSLLAAAGCASRADVGYFVTGPTINHQVSSGELKLYEYSNVVLTNRLMAAAMGISFISVSSFGGTNGFTHSAAKLITDPYSGDPVVIVPALHPDVALIHAHQADALGNTRIFGTAISPLESALASKRVIVSTEELIDTDEIRRNPGLTTIPYYAVDAVVHTPLGAYPGEMPGLYASDAAHVQEVFAAVAAGDEETYLRDWVFGVADDAELLDRLVGPERLADLKRRATITQGYGVMRVPIGTPAASFNEREHQICVVARLIEGGTSYWVAGGGSPLAAILLGKQLYAPSALYATEDGALSPEPKLPFDPMMSMMSSRAGYRALQWGTMNSIGFHAALGYMDVGILNALQVDRHGNINSTAIGDYDAEHRRFAGPGGADTIAAACWQTILLTDQQKRKFVAQVDFISSPGFLDGGEFSRQQAGLPADTGPACVVTPWALFDYEGRELRLAAVSPFVTAEDVLSQMSFEPKVASRVRTLDPPTEEELAVLRTELDPIGQITAGSRWVERVGDEYRFGE